MIVGRWRRGRPTRRIGAPHRRDRLRTVEKWTLWRSATARAGAPAWYSRMIASWTLMGMGERRGTFGPLWLATPARRRPWATAPRLERDPQPATRQGDGLHDGVRCSSTRWDCSRF